MGKLISLNLSGNRIGDEGAICAGTITASVMPDHLANSGPLISGMTRQEQWQLRHIWGNLPNWTLASNCIDNEGALALAISPHLSSLTTLELEGYWRRRQCPKGGRSARLVARRTARPRGVLDR